MEKVRVALEVLKKYHFWILLVLIVLITFGTWYMATSDREAAFSSGKAVIDGSFTTVGKITTFKDHPNDDFNKALSLRVTGDIANAPEEVRKLAAIQAATASLTGNVSAAANLLFDDQRKTFKLPPVYPNNPAEQARFEDDFWKVWNHKIEDIETPPPEATNKEQYELDRTFRLAYRDQIKDIFPSLFEMIELRTPAEPGGNAGSGVRPGQNGFRPGDDPSKQTKGVLDWADAGKLMDYFRNWNDIPTTPDVIVAQENVWVYEALLKVIHNTNDMSDDPKHDPKNYRSPGTHKDARIKEIQVLEIGNEATQSWAACENSVFNFGADSGGATAADTHGGAPGGAPGMGPMPPSGASRGMGFQSTSVVASTSGTAASLLTGRYIDINGKPLADPKQQPNQEFRMMPINMRVVMEQKAIPRLLVECANSNMRIDVRAVRILAEKPGPIDNNGNTTGAENSGGAAATGPQLGNASGMGRSRGMQGYGGHRMMNNTPNNPGQGHAADAGDNNEEESADRSAPPVTVEIQGIIYIYNPPAPPATNGQSQAGTGTTGPALTAPAPGTSGTLPVPGITAPSPAAPSTPAAGTATTPGTAPAATAPAAGPAPAAAPPNKIQPK